MYGTHVASRAALMCESEVGPSTAKEAEVADAVNHADEVDQEVRDHLSNSMYTHECLHTCIYMYTYIYTYIHFSPCYASRKYAFVYMLSGYSCDLGIRLRCTPTYIYIYVYVYVCVYIHTWLSLRNASAFSFYGRLWEAAPPSPGPGTEEVPEAAAWPSCCLQGPKNHRNTRILIVQRGRPQSSQCQYGIISIV